MASRRYTSQFHYSFERFLVNLLGSFTQSGSTGSFASLVSQGVTYTANIMGSGGNAISVTITGGGTAGAEVVSVIGNAISVQVQSGTSTVTQVRTAVNASMAASALVTASGTSSSTVSTHALQNLSGGVSTLFTSICNGGMSLSQIGTGIFQLNIPDSYAALLAANIQIESSSAVDLISQIKSSSLSSISGGNNVQFFMNTAGSPSNLSSGQSLLVDLKLRNSSS